MSTWGPWDWIAYICLAINAGVSALDLALKSSSAVSARVEAYKNGKRFWIRGVFGFLPLTLLLVATTILILRATVIVNSHPSISLGQDAQERRAGTAGSEQDQADSDASKFHLIPNSAKKSAAVSLIQPAPKSVRFNKDKSERVFVKLSPAQLMGLIKEHTDTQIQQLLSPYLGKWMALQGRIKDVRRNGDGSYQFMNFDPLDGRSADVISAMFDKKVASELEMLRVDDVINMACSIAGISARLAIYLTGCELITDM